MSQEVNELIESYRVLASSGLTSRDFYIRARRDGVSKFAAFVLLRDLFNLNLMECEDIHRATVSTDHQH